jgi:MarR family transcriptional regulator, transcriptional regulator for hemolysin
MQIQHAGGLALAAQIQPLSTTLIRAANRATDDAPITTTQRFLLLELVDSGPLRLGTLADRIGMTDPTTSRAVDGLVAAGLVERQADPGDRRAVLHVATASAKAWVERRRAVVAEVLDEALSRLSEDERKSLLELLMKLNEELR